MNVRIFSASRKGFTLIELLVVIAIIAILSVVVILTLNPAELLRQSRDANRISDVSTINTAINLYSTDQSVSASFSLGTASTTYISIPDPSATSTAGDQCQGLGLPTIPSSTGAVYHCATSSTFRNTDGTGWLPINFKAISSGAPFGNLPVDAVNTTSSGNYYSYLPGATTSYELITHLESQKYQTATAANDGGYSNGYYEVGKDLTLALSQPWNIDRVTSTDYLTLDTTGLVGYWPLNEGVGTTIHDLSATGDNGTTTWTWIAGKVGPSALTTVSSASLIIPATPNVFPSSQMTVTAWVNVPSFVNWSNFLQENWAANGGWIMYSSAGGGISFVLYQGGQYGPQGCSVAFTTSTWHYAVGTYNGNTISSYLDGVLCGTATLPNYAFSSTTAITSSASAGSYSIDDIRLYNRALSAQEIQAIYTAEK